MHFVIGLLIVRLIFAAPALRNVAFALLGVAVRYHANPRGQSGDTASPRTLRVVAVSTALLLAPLFPAWAQTDQQIGWCNGNNNATPGLSISGCTAMIQSGEYAGDELAIVFSNRGVAYFMNGQSESAIQDYDRAISLRLNFFSALIGRGFAYLNMKNYAEAIADFNTALKAHPENAAPCLYGRGLANRARGDAAGASADITAAQRLDPTIVQEFASWGINYAAPTSVAVLPEVQPKAGLETRPQPEASTGATADGPSETSPARAPAEETASLQLPADVTEALIKRGDELLSTGDIVAARSAYERAAAGGNRVAATGAAKTYDPVFLAQTGVRGLRGDPSRAALWYGKASAAGDREAQLRLRRLRAQFPQ